ncbi:MAG TPA: type II secretion system protein [Thermodesulfovibrionales bacterium]|nr:type II secretion system protein [Thermodesulfovibrionales bacterium]
MMNKMARGIGNTEYRRYSFFTVSPFRRFAGSLNSKAKGFTLLEILVTLALIGIAITVILQLFSSNLRAISVSKDYVSAAIRAEAKMREILEDTDLTEKSWSEVTDEGYRFDAAITETLQERTENLQVRMLEIALTVQWSEGLKTKFLTLKTLKVVIKRI